MSKNLEEIELRSEEVQEILSKTPSWMIRWGSLLLFSLIILILTISYVIKYPDIISSEVLVTSESPPQKEYAGITAKLDSIYVKESQEVAKNTVLAVLENPADAEDVFYLKSILDTLEKSDKRLMFPVNKMPALILGDIETAYSNFENNFTEYELNKSFNSFANEAIANETSLNEQRLRLENIQSQYELNLSEFELKKNNLERNKILLEKGVISLLDFENNQLEVLTSEKGLNSLKASISQLRESIANAKRDVNENKITREKGEAKLLRATLQSFNQLKKAIDEWENRYVLKSEIIGRVSFLKFWDKNQTVNQGDLVFTIIPSDYGTYLAKLKAAAQNSGKIEVGQSVNIKLENYPETEFGMLRGIVSYISLTPDSEGYYYIDVALPDTLVTSYHKRIEFKQEMRGVAEIVTEDLRLIERFFYQFKTLFDN